MGISICVLLWFEHFWKALYYKDPWSREVGTSAVSLLLMVCQTDNTAKSGLYAKIGRYVDIRLNFVEGESVIATPL